MRITEVRAVQPPTPKAPPDWRRSMGQILVAIDTDAGLRGYGVGGGGAAGVHIVNHPLREILLGRDPQQIGDLWEEMYRKTLPFGRQGVTIMAISGVDLALWDVRGKAEKLPVCKLLSDSPHTNVPCYASLGTTPEGAAERGFQAFKLHLPAADDNAAKDRIVATVADARQTLGPDVRLMTDAFMRWNVPTTLELADRFQEFAIDWIEEPLLPDDLDGYAALCGRCPIPIAAGEHEFTARSFDKLIGSRLLDVVQPDVTWCGGMTQLIEIYRVARQHERRVCQHRGAEIWGLHAVAALEPDDPLAEEGRTWMDWVGDQPPILDGRIAIPDEPGFGVRIDDSLLA